MSIRTRKIYIHFGLIFLIISIIFTINSTIPNSTIQIVLFIVLYCFYRRIYTYYLKYQIIKAEGEWHLAFNNDFNVEGFIEERIPKNIENLFFEDKRNELRTYLNYKKKNEKKENSESISLKWWILIPPLIGIVFVLLAFTVDSGVAYDFKEMSDYYQIKQKYTEEKYDDIIKETQKVC